MTRTIVYTSYAILPDGADVNAKPVWLDSLVERAATKNKSLNISGVLSYKDGRIIQLIEGGSAELENLFSNISNDDRHQSMMLLLDIKDSQRIFSDWGMVFEADVQASSLFKEFLIAHFDNLIDMNDDQENEMIFFADNVFYDVLQREAE